MDGDHFAKRNIKNHQVHAKYDEIIEATQTRLTFAKVNIVCMNALSKLLLTPFNACPNLTF